MSIFRMFWCMYYLKQFRWYRRWYGGRWEYHYIEICRSYMWLDMHPDRKWPEWRQPCSCGTPIIEDYPQRDGRVPKPAQWPAPPGGAA